jgi:hypothetical protein
VIELEQLDLDAIAARRERAFNLVSQMCKTAGQGQPIPFRMSIPVRSDDTDMVLCDALRDIPKLIAHVQEREQALAALVKAASALVDEGPFSDADHAIWACCAAHWDQDHRIGCPYVATQQAIERARAVLPTQTKETKE